ncbi:MAG: cell division ATP-binding protein FtsE [Candidatus Cloacimonetes bacterium 4572_55]|nr:MAG: cell division ATP-binding protein FtsE [Candidatus Cloacimonetes bacterium 4572_55]
MIHFIHVDKYYDQDWPVLKDINFHIKKGEFVFLTGPSGAGKSTVLNLIIMQHQPTSGKVVVGKYNSQVIHARQIPIFRRTLGIVFQDFKLLTDRTVFENVAFALEVTGASRRQIWRRSLAVLNMVGLTHKRNEMPLHLSGGEQQRIAIARAIVNDPFVLLADEPTGNLDPTVSDKVMQLLLKINRIGTTVIMATHDYHLIETYPFRTLALDKGRLVGSGSI